MLKYLIILGLCCTTLAHAAIDVRSAQLTRHKKMTRLVLDSTEPIAHSSFHLSHPERLVIDLNEVNLTTSLSNLSQQLEAHHPLITSIRVARHQNNTTRLVLVLKSPVSPRVLAVGPIKQRYRLTFDFQPADNIVQLPEPTPRPIRKPVAPSRWQDQTLVLTPRDTPYSTGGRDEPLVIPPRTWEKQAAPLVIPATRPQASATAIESVREHTDTPLVIPPKNKIRFADGNADIVIQPRLTSSKQLRPNIAFYHEAAPSKLKMSFSIAPPARPSRALNRAPKLKIAPQLNPLRAVSAPSPLENFAPREIPNVPFIANAFFEEHSPVYNTPADTANLRGMQLVALDAGHGGADPGALGYYGSSEKNVTLAIARQVKTLLDKTSNLRGVLTRTGDYYLPLAERVNKAHAAHADLFVSIHADAFINTSAHGSSVYTLSKNGASSTAASWLANKENNADLIGGVNFETKDPLLMRTLFDLSQTAAVQDSQKLAKWVLNELGQVNALHRGKVEQAGFAVLKSPKLPSILIETAFISNPNEESRLNDLAYQTQLARAIVKGIQRYFSQSPTTAKQKRIQWD